MMAAAGSIEQVPDGHVVRLRLDGLVHQCSQAARGDRVFGSAVFGTHRSSPSRSWPAHQLVTVRLISILPTSLRLIPLTFSVSVSGQSGLMTPHCSACPSVSKSRGPCDTVRLEAYAINSLGDPQLRWVRGGILSIVGCMQARNASTSPCPACGGRGWKFSRSRRGWVTGTLNRSQTACVRRSCMECRGSGQLTALGGPDS